ncbi:MAG: hypothetical protein IJ529_04265 [Alphaproteobacteria bacterium]|nr:hypothetical protein [Alphaproteobacteria bacterium]MBQ9235650.1 hypothetical protein [Alphaproteobacteria bacterium]
MENTADLQNPASSANSEAAIPDDEAKIVLNLGPLPEDYFDQYITKIIEDEISSGKISKKRKNAMIKARKQAVLSSLKDGICSFNPQMFNEAYQNYISIMDENGYLSVLKPETIDQVLPSISYQVPEFQEINAAIELYDAYSVLTSSPATLNTKSINEFIQRVDNYKSVLSPDNLSSIYYHTALAFDGVNVNAKTQESADQYLLKALSLTSSPKMIDSVTKLLPDTPSKTVLTRGACVRAARVQVYSDDKKPLEPHNLYIIHKIYGDTYRKPFVIGFKLREARANYKIYNRKAAWHYNIALQYCEDDAEKISLLSDIAATGGKSRSDDINRKYFQDLLTSGNTDTRPYARSEAPIGPVASRER